MKEVNLYQGDCLEVLKSLPDSSVDSVVTDPPYGISFMGKKWDYDVPSAEVWQECLRVLKPGGHLLAFAGTRTQHRMAVNIEDAGFEIRDMIAWTYSSGFPKSLDVSKAIAKRAGGALVARDAVEFMRARREELGLSRIEFERLIFGRSNGNVRNWEDGISIPRPELWPDIKRAMGLDETPFDACMERGDEEVSREGGSYGYQKDGERWGNERVIRIPATDTAKQWQGWGTALKPSLEPVTVARKPLIGTVAENVLAHGTGAINVDGCRVAGEDVQEGRTRHRGGIVGNASSYELPDYKAPMPAGRWPANLIHDDSDEVVSLFPADKKGSAARFFYAPKASKKDRGEGNNHVTVKPTDLMRYLCRLVTPPNGVVLDPFMGSGSTGKAAVLEGFNFIGIERESQYLEIAEARISAVNK